MRVLGYKHIPGYSMTLLNALRLSPSNKALTVLKNDDLLIVTRYWEHPQGDYDEMYWIEIARISPNELDMTLPVFMSGAWDEQDFFNPETPLHQRFETVGALPQEAIWIPLEYIY